MVGGILDGAHFTDLGYTAGEKYYLAFRVVCMGDVNATDIAQETHTEILKDAGCMDASEVLTYGVTTPPGNFWEGLDIDDPILASVVKRGNKKDAALLRQRESGTRTKRLVLFKLDHPEPVLHGEEPIWLDGKVAGYLSSAAYGFSLGASVGMGYVHHPGGVNQSLLDHARFTIDVAGEQCAASASLRGFYDPTGARLR